MKGFSIHIKWLVVLGTHTKHVYIIAAKVSTFNRYVHACFGPDRRQVYLSGG